MPRRTKRTSSKPTVRSTKPGKPAKFDAIAANAELAIKQAKAVNRRVAEL